MAATLEQVMSGILYGAEQFLQLSGKNVQQVQDAVKAFLQSMAPDVAELLNEASYGSVTAEQSLQLLADATAAHGARELIGLAHIELAALVALVVAVVRSAIELT